MVAYIGIAVPPLLGTAALGMWRTKSLQKRTYDAIEQAGATPLTAAPKQ